MKVLHIWSVAGVAEVVSKFMDRLFGTESTVLVRRKYDRFGFNQHSLDDGVYRFALRAAMASRRADVVQVHNWDRIIPWVRRFSSSPVVVAYHNFNIANEWGERKKYWARASAKVIVTPGLSDSMGGTVHIPVPVDTELFSDEGHHAPGTALTSEYGATAEAEALAKQNGLELTVLQRDAAPIPHPKMAELLNRFEYYIDIKRPYRTGLPIIQASSKTGLEALACGCKVIRWDGERLEGLPPANRAENVARQYHDLYSGLLRGRR